MRRVVRVPRDPGPVLGRRVTAYKKKTGEPYELTLSKHHVKAVMFLGEHQPTSAFAAVHGQEWNSHQLGARMTELEQAGFAVTVDRTKEGNIRALTPAGEELYDRAKRDSAP